MKNSKFQPPCSKCGGKCCKYVAVQLDKPKTKSDHEHIKWYLLHKNVNVFVDHDKNWFVEFKTPCLALTLNNKCKVYETRPDICRAHCKDEGECEYYDTPYSMYFSTVEEYVIYLASKRSPRQPSE